MFGLITDLYTWWKFKIWGWIIVESTFVSIQLSNSIAGTVILLLVLVALGFWFYRTWSDRDYFFLPVIGSLFALVIYMLIIWNNPNMDTAGNGFNLLGILGFAALAVGLVIYLIYFIIHSKVKMNEKDQIIEEKNGQLKGIKRVAGDRADDKR